MLMLWGGLDAGGFYYVQRLRFRQGAPAHSGAVVSARTSLGGSPGRTAAQGQRRTGLSPPPPPSRAPSLCPATVHLTPSASFNGICNRQ